jgi:multiple sugar transport system substrate-binding protein
VSKEFRAQFLSNIVQKAYYQKHLYAIPIDIHPYVLYYNKAVLQEAGLSDTSGKVLLPKTWDELLAYAKTIKDKTGKWGLTIESQYSGERWWMSLYRQSGGIFYDSNTSTLQIDAEEASEAYKIMKSFYTQKVTPFIPDYAECEQLFLEQQSGFHINGVWAMAVYPNTEGLDFGVTSLPAVEGRQAYTWGDSHAFVFPKTENAEKLNAALTFAQWFSEHSIEWAKAGHLPTNQEVLNSQAIMRLPMREDYIHIGKHVVLAPSVQGWDDMRRFMWDLAQKVNSNLITIEKAIEVLQKKVSEINAM